MLIGNAASLLDFFDILQQLSLLGRRKQKGHEGIEADTFILGFQHLFGVERIAEYSAARIVALSLQLLNIAAIV